MFHVDVTLEDCRIIAVETDLTDSLAVTFVDGVTGRRVMRNLTHEALGKVLLVGLAGYDSPEIPGFTYDSVAAEFADFPNECRPIP